MNKIVPAPAMKERGPEVADLHVALHFLMEKRVFEAPTALVMNRWKRERVEKTYGPVTRALVNVFQRSMDIRPTESMDDATAKALNKLLKKWEQFDTPTPVEPPVGPAAEPASPPVPHRLHGQVYMAHGSPSRGIRLRLLRQVFGGKFEALPDVAEQVTGEDGAYAFTFGLSKGLVLKVFALDGGGEPHALSTLLSNWGDREATKLVLIADSKLQPMVAEYKRLTDDLKKQVPDLAKLAGAKESGDQRDFTLLNRATGWDARAIALRAVAEQLKADAGVGLAQEGLYALLRSGLPSNKNELALVTPAVVEKTLLKARENGIIGSSDAEIKSFTANFSAFATKQRLGRALPGSSATFDQMLEAAKIGSDKDKFAKVLIEHKGDADALWTKAKEAGVSDSSIDGLQRQGRMAFLSGNSLELTTHLAGKRLKALSDLVDQDLHEPAAWEREVREVAGNDEARLAAMIPAGYKADTVAGRLKVYANDMAHKVRKSFPTHALARTIANDAGDSFALGGQRQATATFMRTAADQGFRLGTTPLSQFMNSGLPVVSKLTQNERTTLTRQLGTLQRTYQITPDDRSMRVLTQMGLTSAQAVLELDESIFIRQFEHNWVVLFPDHPVSEEPRLVYRKARQVSSITHNLFTTAQKVESEVRMAGFSAPANVQDEVKSELIRRFPTMANLFGSQDYCECEHCRSVLSPAAYFVDLLQFIDPKSEIWTHVMNDWPASHGGSAYPHGTLKPYDVLVQRRPDLPHIALTCENTHTAMPYIDVVNEVLEYHVAHGALDAAAAHDTDGATTSELLAEPQHVIREAYDRIRSMNYPIGLPYDPWVDTVRRFSEHFDTPLYDLLDAFRPNDLLFSTDGSIDRERICLERLGMTPEEASIYTDPDPLTHGKWSTLYGLWNGRTPIQAPTNAGHATLAIADADAKYFKAGLVCSYINAGIRAAHTLAITSVGASGSAGAGRTLLTFLGTWTAAPVEGDLLIIDAVATLSSARTLSRRLGITYKELLAVVRAGFVNPDLERMRILERLGAGPGQVRLFREAANVTLYNDNKALFAEGVVLSDAEQLRLDGLTDLQKALITDMIGYHARIKEVKESFGITDAEIEAQLSAIPFENILVLVDPDGGCSFDMTTIAHADGSPASEIDLLRMNLLVRLWRKLGWPLEEVDRALQVFVPNAPFIEATLPLRPLRSALVYIAHLVALQALLSLGKQGRLKLLTLWSDIPSFGNQSLYAQLFLTRRILRSDDVFDHPFGQYLSAAGIQASAARRWFTVQRKVAAGERINEAAFAAEATRLTIQYDALTGTQTIAYKGVLTDLERNRLVTLSPAPPAPKDHLPAMLDEVKGLGNAHALIKGHLPAIQGALGLTADEVERILVDQGTTLDVAQLSMPNVSILHRYMVLAKGMKLTVRDLIALKNMCGVDPFTPLHAQPLARIEEDHPYSETLRFVKLASRLRETGLKVDLLDHLVRNHDDLAGKYARDPATTLAFLNGLAKGIGAIKLEHSVPADPTTITDDLLKQKLGLLFPTDVAERFMGMLDGSVEFQASVATPVGSKLDPTRMVGAPGVAAISYSNASAAQKLTYRGVLFAPAKERVLTIYPKPVEPAVHVRSALLEGLLTDVEKQGEAFFNLHFAKRPVGARPKGGFLDPADYGPLFDRSLQLNDEQAEQRRQQDRRTRLANAFLPYLQDRLTEQYIIQQLIARTGAEPALVESLLADERMINDQGALVNAFARMGRSGVSTTFYDAGAAVIGRTILNDTTTRSDGGGVPPVRPAAATGVDMEGYIEVPVGGPYRFHVELDKTNATAELRFDHLPASLFLSGTATSDAFVLGTDADKFVELQPGRLYHFTLKARNLNGGEVRLSVEGEALPLGGLDRLALLPADGVQRALRADALLAKTLLLVQTVGLDERELRYMCTHPVDLGGFDLSLLPTAIDEDRAHAKTLFGQLEHLVDYTYVRSRIAGGTDGLIEVFEKNAIVDVAAREEVIDLLASTLRRDRELVLAALNVLGFAHGALLNARSLERLWTLLERTGPLGASLSDMREWTNVVAPGAGSTRRAAIAEDLKDAVKAHHSEAAWGDVAKSVFDHVRKGKRDALVAFLLEDLGYERMEQLYEHFLIDPGMEPVIQTSRIRLAIASIQLFVQRCLLNLEPQVHPAVISAKHWEWMKRYRVWEANRKIFLFPENWLEPEFRDDKTHLFKELEGALLQGDVSNDLVEDAFFTYLRKLDELARLDIVGMHLETTSTGLDNTLHVIGRTFSQPHKYFYRRYKHRAWTPWEPVSAEIEGDHIVPVVWRDRLYVFWVTFMEKPVPGAVPSGKIDATTGATVALPKIIVEASLHWSEHHNGEWTTRESGGMGGAVVLVSNAMSVFLPNELFVHVSKKTDTDGSDLEVYVHLNGGGFDRRSFKLEGRNSSVRDGSRGFEDKPNLIFSLEVVHANRYSGVGMLQALFKDHIGSASSDSVTSHPILGPARPHKLMLCDARITPFGTSSDLSNPASDPVVAELLASGASEITDMSMPVFYQDGRHTFYIEPSVTEHTLEEWRDYVTQTEVPGRPWDFGDWVDGIRVKPQWPIPRQPWEEPDWGEGTLIRYADIFDDVLNEGTLIRYGDTLLGPQGDPGLVIRNAGLLGIGEANEARAVVTGAVAEQEVVLLRAGADLDAAGLSGHAAGLVVVGEGGYNLPTRLGTSGAAFNAGGINMGGPSL